MDCMTNLPVLSLSVCDDDDDVGGVCGVADRRQ